MVTRIRQLAEGKGKAAKALLKEHSIKSRADINRLVERDVELSNIYGSRENKEKLRAVRQLEKETDGKYTSDDLLKALRADEKYQLAVQKRLEISEQRRPTEELHRAYNLVQAQGSKLC